MVPAHRRIIASVILLSSIGLLTDAHAGAAQQRAVGPKPVGPFPILHLKQLLDIPADRVDAERISIITASPAGLVYLADAKAGKILVFDARGQMVRTVGRPGTGPGEFRFISALGWSGETLAVLDRAQRRISFFAAATGLPTGTLPWPAANGAPVEFLNQGNQLIAVSAIRSSHLVTIRPGVMRVPDSEYRYAPVSMSGVGTLMSALRDSIQDVTGSDCEDAAGNVYSLDPLFPDHGKFRAFGSTGQLITASRDSFKLSIWPSGGGAPEILIGPGSDMPLPNAAWDSVASEYRTATSQHGTLTCTPPIIRPRNFPAVRSIATDEAGTLWIEATTPKGSAMYVLSLDGRAIGSFPMPRGDERVPWFVRHNTLYQVVSDSLGVQGVRIFNVSR